MPTSPLNVPIRIASVILSCLSAVLSTAALGAEPDSRWVDPSPHRVQFVTVAPGVALEVLDWGGAGRPLMLLAGGGFTAHVFDTFAPKLTDHYHVYGLTRRGFGASGFAPADDAAQRLGADVLAALDALKLGRPVLIGHSIAGAEISWVVNRAPERIGGAIYLDAAYSYAFDNGKGSNILEAQTLQAPQPPAPKGAELASFAALHRYFERVNGFAIPEAELRQEYDAKPDGTVGNRRNPPGGAMLGRAMMGAKKYPDLGVPVLAIFAEPHGLGKWVEENQDPAVQTAAKAYATALSGLTKLQIQAVREGLTAAKVLVLPNADHHLYLSNEAEVQRAIRTFVDGLPPGHRAFSTKR